MALSSIEWTNKTWNPTTGCTHISKECKFCYAEKETKRLMHNPKIEKYRQGFDVLVEHPDSLSEPYSWKASTVFVNSMSDLFHRDISLDFIKAVFKVMNETPQHTYQVLTKRHDILEKYSDQLNWTDNIWMGVSVGTQIATRRIEPLVKSGAKHKFLSIEPFLEEINDINLKGIDWVIVGGESGDNRARPIEKDWVLKIKDACLNQNVPFFFKQWGKNRNNPNPDDPTIHKFHRYHSKGGSELDGKTYWANPTISDDSIPTVNLFGNDYVIMDEVNDLVTIWELKSHLPFAEDELFNRLKEDIKKNGVNDPILYIPLSDGKKLVVEGHTRLTALISLNQNEIPTKELNETFDSLEEIKLWMVKHQLQRRNLSNVEKIRLAYLSKSTIEKLAKENLSRAGKSYSKNAPENPIDEIEKIDTHQEIAKIAGLGRTTVVKYSQILNNASKSVIEDLNKGNISIGSAHSTIKNKIEPKKEKNKITTPKIAPIQINSFVNLSSVEEGQQKIKTGEIDIVVVINDESHLDAIKKNPNIKIGIYHLNFD